MARINPYWFKSVKWLDGKDGGFGFIPISWEGGVSYLVFLLAIAFLVFYFQLWEITLFRLTGFIISLIVLFLLFLFLSKNATRPKKPVTKEEIFGKKKNTSPVEKEISQLSRGKALSIPAKQTPVKSQISVKAK
jgi:hypothetical protein